jgi:hypothetical protein
VAGLLEGLDQRVHGCRVVELDEGEGHLVVSEVARLGVGVLDDIGGDAPLRPGDLSYQLGYRFGGAALAERLGRRVRDPVAVVTECRDECLGPRPAEPAPQPVLGPVSS